MEQVLIGQNAGIIWHLLEGKNGVEVSLQSWGRFTVFHEDGL